MLKLRPEQEVEIQHYLNKALRRSLKLLKLKVNEDLAYDIGLEADYEDLKDKFFGHLELIKEAIKCQKKL